MYHCAWPTWLPEVTWPKVTWLRRGSLVRVSALPTENCAISALMGPFDRKWCYDTSPVGLPLKLEVTRPEVPLRCSLGCPRHIILPFSTPFTGNLSLSRHFIFMGSTFNNYISYKGLLFLDRFEVLCSTLSSLSRPRSHCGISTKYPKSQMNERVHLIP
jgi:hypothetical protein